LPKVKELQKQTGTVLLPIIYGTVFENVCCGDSQVKIIKNQYSD